MRNRCARLVLALLGVVSALSPVSGEEEVLRFIRKLQDHGYGDMAVEYLTAIKARPDIPVKVREVWDLEMSRSLRAAAKTAFDAKEAEKLLTDSRTAIEKFIKENPNHPEAVTAAFSVGEFAMDRGLEALRVARALPDKPENKDPKAKLLTTAREAFEEARPRYSDASKKYYTKYAALPPPPEKPTRRDMKLLDERYEAEMNVLNARFQLALLDYYVAQTYPDLKDPARITALKNAVKIFDAIYQTRRHKVTATGSDPIGLLAHMWHGKAMEEMGDTVTALDIYDEVLANTPERGESSDARMEALFAQVEHFRLIILSKKSPKEFMAEATQWLKEFQRFQKTDGFQGISLALVKAKLSAAESASGADKTRLKQDAIAALRNMVKVRSQYQTEAINLFREHGKSGGGASAEASNFDEAIALGDTSAQAGEWDDAVAQYDAALAMAAKSSRKDDRVEGVRKAIANCLYMKARALYTANKMDDCMKTLGRLAGEFKEAAVAPAAAALAVSVRLNQYLRAPADQKPAALELLIRAAKYTEETWPGRPEADDARMTLAQGNLVTGKVEEALAVFEKVNPKSERYSYARFLLGKTHWQRYGTEKLKPEASQNKAQLAADRDKAAKALAESVEAQKQKKVEAGEDPPKHLKECALLLAEIAAERQQHAEAVKLFAPLWAEVKECKAEDVDLVVLRTLIGSLRAYVATKDFEKAVEVGIKLAEVGPKELAAVNGNLVEFLKTLNAKFKEAAAALTDATSANNQQQIAEARKAHDALRDLLGKYVAAVGARENLSSTVVMFIADISRDVGQIEKATENYQKVIDRAQEGQDRDAIKGQTYARVQLFGMLAKVGKFEEAQKQVAALVKANPKSLEPRLQEARILQEWAEKDPSKFPDAVSKWAELRNMLEGVKVKDKEGRNRKAPEYFEVVLSLANCLLIESSKSSDKKVMTDKALQAEQLVKRELVMSPELSGPDMVAKFNAMAARAANVQGRKVAVPTPPPTPAPKEVKPAPKSIFGQ